MLIERKNNLGILIPAFLIWIIDNMSFFQIKLGGYSLIIFLIIEFILFIVFIIFNIKIIIQIIKKFNHSILVYGISLVTSYFFLIAIFISDFRFDENTFQSKVKYRACYDGTMNSSRIFFRSNHSFEYYNLGVFGNLQYQSGEWSKNQDTIYLRSNKEISGFLSEKMIIKDEIFYLIKEDTIIQSWFYLGHCQGLN